VVAWWFSEEEGSFFLKVAEVEVEGSMGGRGCWPSTHSIIMAGGCLVCLFRGG